MNRDEALARLALRVKAKLSVTRQLNDAGAKKCVSCGETGKIWEKAMHAHVFCTVDCVRHLHGLDALFSLGVKRGSSVITEAVPVVTIEYLPDDVLEVIFIHAYHRELLSEDEYDELFAMRKVSDQFERVINKRVVPGIRFLCGEIMRHITPVQLALFTGLWTFYYSNAAKRLHRRLGVEKVTLELDGMPEQGLDQLRGLTLINISFLRHPEQIASKQFLVSLSLDNVGVPDAVFDNLLQLESLTIKSCATLSDRCLLPLRRLSSLSLFHVANFENLNMCQSLRQLTLYQGVDIAGDGIRELTGLQRLALPGFAGEPTKRSVDAETLLLFTNLTELDLEGNQDYPDDVLNQLTSLTKLNIAFADMDYAALPALTRVTSLDMSAFHMDPRLAQATNLIELYLDLTADIDVARDIPPQIETLSLDYCDIARGSLATLQKLRCLHLFTCRGVHNEDIRSLTGLEVLDLSNDKNINNGTVRLLTNLEELVLYKNQRITFDTVAQLPRLRYLVATKSLLKKEDIQQLRQRGIYVFDDDSVEGLDPLPPRYRKRYPF
jgi:hypothetical protein